MKKTKKKQASKQRTGVGTRKRIPARHGAKSLRAATKAGRSKARSALAQPDKPNQAWLTIHVDSVDGDGGSDMAFTASLWDTTVGFGVDTGQERRRILYDGPYKEPPYNISISARERDPNSDDEFTDATINLGIDLSTLQGSASATISQVAGDQDDDDTDDDDPNAEPDPDEQASYTVTCSGIVTPAVEITGPDFDDAGPLDVRRRRISFSVLPKGISGRVSVIAHGQHGAPKELISNEPVSGGDNIVKVFEWESFGDLGDGFLMRSVEVRFAPDSTEALTRLAVLRKDAATPETWLRDVRAMNAEIYGEFRISKFVTPDNDQWTGATETADFEGTKVQVHTTWIDRVRGSEGKGAINGRQDIVKIRGPGEKIKTGLKFKHPPGTQTLSVEDEGHWARRLRVDRSLAKHEDDDRFHAHDRIVLSTDPGITFYIEDTGNWDDDPPGEPHDHFDRYAGFAGPSTPDRDYPPAYVARLPRPRKK